MKRFDMRVFLVLAMAVMTGCARTPDEVVRTRVERVTDMTFVKHQNGLCFAITESRSHGGWPIASVTNIPCQSGDTVFVR
jgi:starvation-inducible outer membrane lipoprotein